ncbi:unnamed protein product [Nesidiocoris tenuis]|uniref:Uncharacterized protein n=1 Tax=Nesidiocoris tenuis TaxID=355587 RepID=A0A6H5GU84_9HEMI|nr:unnamed protein product [Nesidiocoris tenuis]
MSLSAATLTTLHNMSMRSLSTAWNNALATIFIPSTATMYCRAYCSCGIM